MANEIYKEIAEAGPTVDMKLACKAIGVSYSHGYALAREEQFPVKALKLDTSYRVVTADLRRLLDIEPGK